MFNPVPRFAISCLGYLARFIPFAVLSRLFQDWPQPQVQVLRELISSPSAIDAALSMAYDEMRTIKDLDLALLQEFKDKLCFYYAEEDDWVGEEKARVLNALHPDEGAVTIVQDVHGIPHAFCISKSAPFRGIYVRPTDLNSGYRSR